MTLSRHLDVRAQCPALPLHHPADSTGKISRELEAVATVLPAASRISPSAKATRRPVLTTRPVHVNGPLAALTGRSFLVNIMDAPAGRISAGQERGAVVTILQATEVEEVIWYQIQAAGGTGWVRWDNLVPGEGGRRGARGRSRRRRR